jgi:agmatinase
MNLLANKWTFLDLAHLPARKHGKVVGDVGILGIPFDNAASYRTGQRNAPVALRMSSIMLMDGSPAFAEVDPRENLICVDLGDVDTAVGDVKTAHKNIVRAYTRARKNLKQVVAMGGDHYITLPILQSLVKKLGQPVVVVHFDAHHDLWNEGVGTKRGHGTWLRNAIDDGLVISEKSVLIGIRSPSPRETQEYAKEKGLLQFNAQTIHTGDINYVSRKILERVSDSPVYLSFDIDAIDPSQAPGTGTPESAGLWMHQVFALFESLTGKWQRNPINWVGADFVELLPDKDPSGVTSLALATTMYWYLTMQALPHV